MENDKLQAIEKQSKMFVAYNESQLKNQKSLDLNIHNQPIDDVLVQILRGTGFSYQLKDNYIVIVPERQITQKQVNGTISDENGEPVIGANVVEKGTTTWIKTNRLRQGIRMYSL